MNRPSYTCRLSRLEWLNMRGWPTFKDFMVTHKYDPTSAADYMKAEEVLCNYRSSDPFANKELQDWGAEEDEGLEELEDNDMDEKLDVEFEKLLCDALASEEYTDDEDIDEGTKEKNCDEGGVEEHVQDNNQERDEILDLMTDDSDWEDYDEDEDPDAPRTSNLKRNIEVREQEKLENIYRIRNEDEGIYKWLMKRGWSCLEEYMDYQTLDFTNSDDVEKVGHIIKKSIRLEAEQNRDEAEGGIEEVAAEDDAEYENEQRATRESLISEGLGDEVEFPRNANPEKFDEEQATASPSASKIANGIKNNLEIDRWCMEQGYINLFNYIIGHGGDYYDDELVCMIGHQLKKIIEEGNQNRREVMEEIFEGLTMCDTQDQGLKENFQNWSVADNEEMNRLDGDDEMTHGWL
ncbi:uncharacterized protein EAE97_007433 [Botrytis byssoidea]|uniref:Uncharacterized protein n=1 Tax=Botrytis byssoidea TaxID=139641 RepID=A0A9P5LT07_9HELO|nr:uncharacterized protein EAE97_007433 [Botrytis byssoidea]KAF7939353.1 hypothetical protein EAE97_007433 [Botrytis byssoidea]